MEQTHSQIYDYAGALSFGFVFWLIVTYIARKRGFFKLPAPSNIRVSLIQFLGGVLTYVISSIAIAPFFLAIVYYIFYKQSSLKEIAEKPWWPLVSIVIIFIGLSFYAIFMKRDTLKGLFFAHKNVSFKEAIKNLIWGALGWLISYPAVIFAGTLGTFISYLIFGKSGVRQNAVQYLLNTAPYPILFIFTIIALVTIVPFLEEFLFRGLLQTWLRNYVGRIGAILISSIIFAFAHFSISQGVGNLELIISLFALACYMGFIYERQQSLFASIGLHMTFNAFSILLLLTTQI